MRCVLLLEFSAWHLLSKTNAISGQWVVYECTLVPGHIWSNDDNLDCSHKSGLWKRPLFSVFIVINEHKKRGLCESTEVSMPGRAANEELQHKGFKIIVLEN